MRIFVTGGAGYVGSHACKEFFAKGHEVLVYDNLSNGHREFVRYGDFVHGDINDTQKLRECFKRFRPDGVVHFAASAYVGESVLNPGKYFRNNVAGTLSLLEAIRDEGIINLVVSSSCAVYGAPDNGLISEDTPKNPTNPYGASKLFMERMAQDFSVAHGLQYASLRYFNAGGCDEDGEIGERHDPETHVIPIALKVASGKLPEFEIFGSDYPTPDGSCVRDYVHVKDLGGAHVMSLEYLAEHKQNLELNLGTGRGYSVKEIVSGVEKITGKKLNIKITQARAGDPPLLIANATRAKNILNWQPKHSALDNILSTAWKWERK